MTAIDDLIERVESGEGADRELDALVLCAVLAPEGSKVEKSRLNGAWCIYSPLRYGSDPWSLWPVPMPWRAMDDGVTASLDAVVSLIEQKLPGWKWGISSFAQQFKGNAWSDEIEVEFVLFAKSPARAMLAATLRAIKEQSHGA